MSDMSITVIYHGMSLTVLYIIEPVLILNIAEILLKVALNTINQIKTKKKLFHCYLNWKSCYVTV